MRHLWRKAAVLVAVTGAMLLAGGPSAGADPYWDPVVIAGTAR